MRQIFTAKKLEDAKRQAVQAFGVSESQIVFRILEQKKGLMGIGASVTIEAIYEPPVAAVETPAPAAEPMPEPQAAAPVVEETVETITETVVEPETDAVVEETVSVTETVTVTEPVADAEPEAVATESAEPLSLDSLTPEQQQVVDEAGQKAVEYERYINRSGDEEIMSRWEKSNGVTFTKKEDMDIDSFKKAVDGIDDWFVKELKSEGYDDAQDLVDLFTEDSVDTVEDYSDLNWPETTWNFACSTTETSTWADGGRKFGELMEKATGGKVKVNIYAADQLTNGNQSEGIQALMNGDPVQISMHSNLIYSAFDPRFNVVSLPFIYDSYDDADAKFDGEAGDKLKEILNGYGLHCMGIPENGYRD